MIQAEIKKDIQHNYMIIRDSSEQEQTFHEKMILHNEPEGFLPFRTQYMNGQRELYYELHGYQSLAEVISKVAPKVTQLRNMLMHLFHTIDEMKEYLLKEDDLVLSMEYMFVKLPDYSPYLCYYSGYRHSIKKQLSEFLEALMECVDYQDKDAVYLIYTLYIQSKNSSCTTKDLIEVLQNEDMKQEVQAEQRETVVYSDVNAKNIPQIPAAVEASFVPPNQPAKVQYSETVRNKGAKTRPLITNQHPQEQEIMYYPAKIYIAAGGLTIGAILLCIFFLKKGFLTDPVTGKLEPLKFVAMMFVLTLPLAYGLIKLFHPQQKAVKRIEVDLYEPVVQQETAAAVEIPFIYPTTGSAVSVPRRQSEQENKNRMSMEDRATMLLNGVDMAPYPQLIPENPAIAETMTVMECPYFIGTVKNKMNYALSGSAISRYHAKIEEMEGVYYIIDLGSTNGTFVNGRRIQAEEPSLLVPGDKIAFANICFIYTCPNK